MSKEQLKSEKVWLDSISNDFPYAFEFFLLYDSDGFETLHEKVDDWFKSEGYRIEVSVDSHRWTGAWYKTEFLEPRVGNSEFYYGTGGRLEAFEFVATIVFKRLNEKYVPAKSYDSFLEDISDSAIKRDKMKKFWSSDKGAEMRRKSLNNRKMAKKRIAIVTPTRDGLVDMNYTNSVFHTQKILSKDYDVELSLLSGVSDIVGGRNKIFNKWYYDTDVEYLLWVDSDISYSPLDLQKMLEFDVDVIGGNYPKKKMDVRTLLQTASLMQNLTGEVDAQSCLEASFEYVVGGQTNIIQGGDLDGLSTCEMLGMGMMLMKREGADKLVAWCDKNMTKKSWPWNGKMIEGYGVFDSSVNSDGHNLAEDFAFCSRLKEAGIKLYFHPRMKIRHSGYMAFDGDFQQVVDLAMLAYENGQEMPGTNYKKTSIKDVEEEKTHEPQFED